MRTIKDIKRAMTQEFMRMPIVQQTYGIAAGRDFDDVFSPASVESILFYVFATGLWALESLFHRHSRDVATLIEAEKPHTLRWYAERALAYQHGCRLIPDTDTYDNSHMRPADIEAARIVRHAVATESQSVVYVKVATTDAEGGICALTQDQRKGLKAYLREVKDAGVAVTVRSEEGERLEIATAPRPLTVYYDASLLDGDGHDSSGAQPVVQAVKDCIAAIPFDGVFRTHSLIAAIASVPGVKAVGTMQIRKWTGSGDDFEPIDAYDKPYAGYYTIADEDIHIDYQPYDHFDTDD